MLIQCSMAKLGKKVLTEPYIFHIYSIKVIVTGTLLIVSIFKLTIVSSASNDTSSVNYFVLLAFAYPISTSPSPTSVTHTHPTLYLNLYRPNTICRKSSFIAILVVGSWPYVFGGGERVPSLNPKVMLWRFTPSSGRR